MNSVRCGSCFIVPPFMLEEMVRQGTQEQREAAIDTLSLDAAIRAQRIQMMGGRRRVPAMLHELAAPVGHLRRAIYDAHNREDALATDLVRQEGDPETGDAAVNEAYDGFGATHRLFWEVYWRDSIDGHGLALEGVVHYGEDFDNAFWNGARMVFGDGDGEIMTRTTAALDVIGHELTHGIIEYEANLAYVGQSGALNESVSDVFGSLVKQYHLGQSAAEANWLIGEGIVGPAITGRALRSLAAPGTAYDGDPQPAHMRGYVTTTRDNGGVHLNSGIPNHAFYLVAMGLGGFAWERAGAIWYQSIRDPRLHPGAKFHDFAQATRRSALLLYGADSEEVGAVTEAWGEVGVSA